MAYDVENARMIEWLKGKPPIIVHAAAVCLNWDFAESTIEWVVKSQNADQATASALFFLSCPSNHHPFRSKTPDGSEIVRYPGPTFGDDIGLTVARIIADRWLAGSFLSGNVELDHRKEFEYHQFKIHPDVYFYLSAQKEFGPLGKMPWPELVGIEGPFAGQKLLELLEYLQGNEDETFEICALYEDLGFSFGRLEGAVKSRYLAWRVANGFGERPSWDKR